MIIYLETRDDFLKHVRRNRIEEEVGERLKLKTGRRVSPSEVRAWRNSLLYVSNILQAPETLAALGVASEFQIHNTSRRIDLLLSGRSADQRHAAVIVELKQWEQVAATDMDGLVRTVVGGGLRDLTHPSYQAWSYSCLLQDVNTAVQEPQAGPKPPRHRSRGRTFCLQCQRHTSRRRQGQSDHASPRAGVRGAATLAREVLAACDILNLLPPVGDSLLTADGSKLVDCLDRQLHIHQTDTFGQILIKVQSLFFWLIGFGW